MSLSYHMFGVNEFSARFPSAVFGMGLIVLQYLFLARSRGPVVALFGAAMLLLNVQILGLGRMALTDSALIFFIALSLYGFWLGFYGEGRTRHWMWIFYVGMALATLTKGPVGFLRSTRHCRSLSFSGARVGRILATRPPYSGSPHFPAFSLALVCRHADDSWQAVYQFGPSGYSRAIFGSHGRPRRDSIVLHSHFPGGILSLEWMAAHLLGTKPSGAGVLPGRRAGTQRSMPLELRLDWFAAIWVLAGLVFFSLSSTRLPHYIAPLFPAAAILTASFWSSMSA